MLSSCSFSDFVNWYLASANINSRTHFSDWYLHGVPSRNFRVCRTENKSGEIAQSSCMTGSVGISYQEIVNLERRQFLNFSSFSS